MVAAPRLDTAQREQAGDARLLLESAAHNAALVLRRGGELDDEGRQALENAAAMAAQAAGTLRRLVLAQRKA